jgi:hypothetical protein
VLTARQIFAACEKTGAGIDRPRQTVTGKPQQDILKL